MNSNVFDRLSSFSLFSVVVLLPVFSLPFTYVPVEISKGLLLVVGLTICIISWTIARFLDGQIIFPKSWLLLSGFGVVLTFLLSALLSGNSKVSLFGIMFDIGSFWFIFAGFILMIFSSIIFRTPKRAKIVLLGIIISSVFVLLFQSIHLFLPKITSLGILTEKTTNILGSWNALGLFAGFSCLMFLLLIEFFPISKLEKLLLKIFILLSILLIAAVNFPLIWILLGISSLIIFVYKASITLQRDLNNEDKETKKKNFPLISLIIVLASLLFFLNPSIPMPTPTPIGNVIPNYLKISYNEVGPSFAATMSVTGGVLMKDPIFGIGPNRFGEAWSMYKPQLINNTQFWDISFSSGSGLLPFLTTTTGGLNILAWLVFFALFLIIGTKSVFASVKNGANWEMMAFFVLSLYLFISSFFYSAGVVIFLLALSFTGIFIGLVANVQSKEISISFLNDHRKSFFSILSLICIIIFSITVLFKYVERFISFSYYQKAISVSTIPEAEDSIGKALSLHSNDLYLRTYSQIYLTKLNSLVSRDSALSDTEKQDLQAIFDQAVSSAQQAVAYNSSNYLNFQLLGSVYQIAALLGVPDAYNRALEAYEAASNLNPNNPGLKLSMAGASQGLGKIEDAKNYANQSLSLKPDYIDALITLSQIAKSEGNNTEALSFAEKALSFYPTNTDLIKYVDSLRNGTVTPTPDPKKS